MASVYPGALDNLTLGDAPTNLVGPDVEDLKDATNKIEAELGVNPSNTYATVRARLDAIATASAHKATHETGGSDALTGTLDANARVAVRSNTGAVAGTRRGLNIIAGTNVTVTAADNAASERVDVTISSAAAGGGGGGVRGATKVVAATGSGWVGDYACDGVADEVQINQAINDLTALGGGTVQLSQGTFTVAAAIAMKSGVTLQGAGGSIHTQAATRITRSANVPIIDIIGGIATTGNSPAIPTRIYNASVRDIYFDGTSAYSASMFRMYYAGKCIFRDLRFSGHGCIAIDCGAEAMDSLFDNLFLQEVGGEDGTKPAIYVRSRLEGATSGVLGYSTDSSNNLWFTNLHIETCYDGAIWCVGYSTGNGSVNKMRIVNCKIESTQMRGPMVKLDNVDGCEIFGLEMTCNGFRTGYSTIITAAAVFGVCSGVHIFGVFASIFVANMIDSFFRWDQNFSMSNTMTGLSFSCASAKPVTACIRFVNSPDVIVLGVGYQWNGANSELFSGAPSSKQPVFHIPRNAGAVTDAAFTPPGGTVAISPLPGTMMYDETNGRLYVKKSDGTWHYATLT